MASIASGTDRLSRQDLTCHGVFEAYALPARIDELREQYLADRNRTPRRASRVVGDSRPFPLSTRRRAGLSTPEIAPFRRRWPNRSLGLVAIRGGQVHTLTDLPQPRRTFGHAAEQADGGGEGAWCC